MGHPPIHDPAYGQKKKLEQGRLSPASVALWAICCYRSEVDHECAGCGSAVGQQSDSVRLMRRAHSFAPEFGVTSRRPGAWKARDPDRRRSGGFGLSAKSDTKRIVLPFRGRQRAGCLVSTGPAPLLAGKLKVTGLKRANVGELLARLSFRQEAGDCETYFVGFKAVRRCRTVRQRPMRLGRHDDFPPSATAKNRHTAVGSAILISKSC